MRPEEHEFLPCAEHELVNTRILVKIGSASLVKDRTAQEPVNTNTLDSIAREISCHIDRGGEIVLVTSGAVATGKWLSQRYNGYNEHELSKQYFAAIGQPALMQYWIDSFEQYGKLAGQILVTDRDIAKTTDLIAEMARAGTVPIINANDAVDTSELNALTIANDNDQLSTHIAIQTGCNAVVFLTNVPGVMNGNECIADGRLIQTEYILQEKSNEGTGGMYSKVEMAQLLISHGIQSIIAHADTTEVIGQFASGRYSEMKGTRFIANEGFQSI